MTCWQSHSNFLAEMRLSARRPDCSLPRLVSSTVLMPWPMLGGYRFTASQAEYLKTGLKKCKNQEVEWMQEGNASFSLCCGRKEHSCGSCEKATVSMEYTAHGAFCWGSPVTKDIINLWWLKTAPPDSHVVNSVLLMSKHSSLSGPVV